LNTQEIVQIAKEFGLKISNLDDLDEKTLADLHQAIIEYKENRCNIHTIDYMW